jgi:hypothetical protein
MSKHFAPAFDSGKIDVRALELAIARRVAWRARPAQASRSQPGSVSAPWWPRTLP